MIIAKTIMVEGDGIALDRLLFDVMGREDLVPAVLEANPGLAQIGPVLPVGTRVMIPQPPAAEATPIIATVKLWDE
ncbi:MAG: tail protein X [Rhabdaerophilum sp.]